MYGELGRRSQKVSLQGLRPRSLTEVDQVESLFQVDFPALRPPVVQAETQFRGLCDFQQPHILGGMDHAREDQVAFSGLGLHRI